MAVDDRLCRAGANRAGARRRAAHRRGQAGPGRPCRPHDGDAVEVVVAGVRRAVTGRPAAGGASIEGRPRANSQCGARSG